MGAIPKKLLHLEHRMKADGNPSRSISILTEPPPWARDEWHFKKERPDDYGPWEENETHFDSDTIQRESLSRLGALYQWRMSPWIPGGTVVTYNGIDHLLNAGGEKGAGWPGMVGITVNRRHIDPEQPPSGSILLSDQYVPVAFEGWDGDLLYTTPQSLACSFMDELIRDLFEIVASAEKPPISHYAVYEALVDKRYEEHRLPQSVKPDYVDDPPRKDSQLDMGRNWRRHSAALRDGIVSPTQINYILSWLAEIDRMEQVVGPKDEKTKRTDYFYSVKSVLDGLAVFGR